MKRTKLENVISISSNRKFLKELMEMYNPKEVDSLYFLENTNRIEELSENKKRVLLARLNLIKTYSTPLPMISVLITGIFTVLNSFILLQMLNIADFLSNHWGVNLSDNELSNLNYLVFIILNIAVILFFTYSYYTEQKKISHSTYLLELFK